MKKFSVIPVFIASLLATQALALPNPVAWWKFDEGTGSTSTDSSGNGHNATTGGTWVGNGMSSNAMTYTTNQFTTVPYSALFNLSNSISLSIWIKPSGPGLPGPNFSRFFTKDTGYNNGWQLTYDNALDIQFQMTGMYGNYISSASHVPTNLWTHVVATFDGTTAKLYINGLLDRFATWSGSCIFTTNGIQVGGLPGAIDDARVYSNALTEIQVAQLFLEQDTDRDRLVDANEAILGTDPNNPDSDGDGYPDGMEVAAGTDPLNLSSHPDLTTGLVGWWKFDEGGGTLTADSTTNGDFGTVTSGSTWVTGIHSNALQFDGVNGFVAYSDWGGSGSPLAVTNFTLSFFAFVTNTAQNSTVLDRSGGNSGYQVVWQSVYNRVIAYFPNAPIVTVSLTDVAANTWNHFAFTYDGATLTAYLNGQEVAQAGCTNPVGISSFPLYLAQAAWFGNRFQGKLDDVRVYNRALAAGDIIALALVDTYGNGLPDIQKSRLGLDPNTASTTGDGIPDDWAVKYGLNPLDASVAAQTSTLPFTHGLSNLQVYQNQSVLIADNYSTFSDGIPDWWRVKYFGTSTTSNSSSCASCDPDGDGYSNLQEYNLGTDPTNSASYPAGVPLGLIAWWKLDEGAGTNAADSSGNGNAATLAYGPVWTNGIFGDALLFDGASTEVDAPISSSLNVTNALTISLWVNTANNSLRAVASYRSEEYDSGWRLFYSTGHILYQWASPTGVYHMIDLFGSYPSNAWANLAVTFSPTNTLVYLDGVLIGADGSPGSSLWLSANYPLRVGRTDNGNSYWFQGKIDDVRLYNRVLGSNEVAALYNTDSVGDGIPDWWRLQYFGSGSTTNSSSCAACDPDGDGFSNLQEYNLGTDPTNSVSYPATVPPNMIAWWKLDEGTGTNAADSSGNGNAATLAYGPTWVSGIFSNALLFDGASAEVDAPISNSLNVTNALTVSLWAKTTNSALRAVASYRAEEYDSGWRLFYSTGHILFQWASPTGVYHMIDLFGSYPSNAWANLAVTFSPTNTLVYLDGVLIGADGSPGSSLWLSANYPLRIGRTDNGNSYWFQGKIDDVQLYNRVLGADEIAAMNTNDSVGDGISDRWRLQYFGSATTTNSSSCATCDPDGDTYNNLQEYTMGTDPMNSASYPPAVTSTNQITSAPIIPWEYADSFSVTNSALSLYPTNRVFFFRVGDSVAISNTDSGYIDVWNVKGGRAYRGAASGFSTNLPSGHYFVESKTDRLQFMVLPNGYTDAPGWGSDNQPTFSEYYAYGVSAGIHTVRFMGYWENMTTADQTWGQLHFSTCGFGPGCGYGLDDAIAEAASATNNLIIQLGFWPSYATNASECTLARYLEYVSNVCVHVYNATNGNVVTGFTLWNEPWYTQFDGTNFLSSVPDYGSDGSSTNLDWDWSEAPFNGTPTTFTHWLTAMYTNAIPIIRSILPNAKIYGVSGMNWGTGLGIQTNILAYGGLNMLDGVSHHFYDDQGRPDEVLAYGTSSLSLDQWIDLYKTDWPTTNSLFCMDEYNMDGNCLSIGSTQSVMGITQLSDLENGSEQAGLMNWWNGYCDTTKEAVIFASRGVLPIFQDGLTGSHDDTSGEELALSGFAASNNSNLTRGPYPRISAWTAAWDQLKGLTFVGQAVSTNGIISYTFTSGTGTNVFRWCKRGVSANLPSAQNCTDIFGNALYTSFITDEPLIFNQ